MPTYTESPQHSKNACMGRQHDHQVLLQYRDTYIACHNIALNAPMTDVVVPGQERSPSSFTPAQTHHCTLHNQRPLVAHVRTPAADWLHTCSQWAQPFAIACRMPTGRPCWKQAVQQPVHSRCTRECPEQKLQAASGSARPQRHHTTTPERPGIAPARRSSRSRLGTCRGSPGAAADTGPGKRAPCRAWPG
jgi:hypothetical protein